MQNIVTLRYTVIYLEWNKKVKNFTKHNEN